MGNKFSNINENDYELIGKYKSTALGGDHFIYKPKNNPELLVLGKKFNKIEENLEKRENFKNDFLIKTLGSSNNFFLSNNKEKQIFFEYYNISLENILKKRKTNLKPVNENDIFSILKGILLKFYLNFNIK